mmetsp:Transcript_106789/g.168734  ORF Transcript_106789/g.168734 Transcript_106789/m.168734 type:complete len:82 (+) Transcript_106789:1323-1568(+)
MQLGKEVLIETPAVTRRWEHSRRFFCMTDTRMPRDISKNTGHGRSHILGEFVLMKKLVTASTEVCIGNVSKDDASKEACNR